jgi:signal transduction histidine kinase
MRGADWMWRKANELRPRHKHLTMITLSDFFELNREIILFVYGLVFFLLGFAIILQTRQSSRLDLARNLRWLAAFGITHGFYEWGDLFIPIQGEYLDEEITQVLYFFHLILLAFSFICLLEFGLAFLYPKRRANSFHWQSLVVFGVWMAVVFSLPLFMADEHLRRYMGNTLARYFIQLPGGILAAYGLWTHALERIAPLNAPKIINTLRITVITIVIYSVFGALTPPPVEFFPGNVLNIVWFTQVTGIPPLVFRSLTGIIITITLIRALEIFELETERRIEQLEQQQIINTEQERLARNLHDGAIQKVYTAGLLVESAARIADPGSELDKRLKRAVVALSDSILDLRQNLSELHSHTQAVQQPLPELLQKIVENPNYNTMVHITIKNDLPADKSISAMRSSHVFAIVNEAMANTVRHAQARNVSIETRDLGESLQIQIKDDGTGLSPDSKNGYGLRNMRDRARLLNGNIEFENNRGLVVTFVLPWKD